MKTLNSIAIEYLLRNDSQKNNNKSEDLTKEVTRLNAEQEVIRSQKSLLLLMYNLEEEGEDFFIQ
ncbi:hypothetical protein B0A79_06375 [Flavobacterium piscis]|uniref:Uncharacterized protein n=1 Tax=Flavobacterium piscis TaxID=1114874 RepID=A0ABX2XK34_9FLAO|nr:hypothetical protein [Flavobacterium piscis]OCB75680.1 hypothetical protein FLP_09470 [Flavobacterium piscis]OXG06121.1 hypothetical protein B0A79_06375 [Flavobacterium piscis]